MDRKKQLRDSLHRLSKMTANTPYDQVYKQIDDIVNGIEGVARETAASLFQKLVDILKVKEQPQQEEPKQDDPVAPVEEVDHDDHSDRKD